MSTVSVKEIALLKHKIRNLKRIIIIGTIGNIKDPLIVDFVILMNMVVDIVLNIQMKALEWQ